MHNIREGFRLFKQGFNRRLIWAYLVAVAEHGWEILWGAGLFGIAFTIYTLYHEPAGKYLGWVLVWIVVVAGYYTWRADHVRLIPKFHVTELIAQPTETESPQIMNMFIQIVPECLTDSPVFECRGRLLRVFKRYDDQEDWTVTQMNSPLFLGWDYYGHGPFTLEPGIRQRLNVCWWSSDRRFVIPAVDPLPSKVRVVFDSPATFRFDIRLTARDCAPVDVSVTVKIALRKWDDPVLELMQGHGVVPSH